MSPRANAHWADANSTVAVNGSNATWVEDFWFNQQSFSGNNSAQYVALNITATLGGNMTSTTGHRFLKAHPTAYAYDADGNLLTDGRWNYAWDAENRLTALETTSAAVSAGAPKEKVTYAYDSNSRKVEKQMYAWNSGTSAWDLTGDLKYLYDGANLIAEVDALPTTPVVARTYAWGLGGNVGGLLMAKLSDGTTSKMVYYGYDGNGNVNALVDTSGNVVGSYDYNPFGELVSLDGDWARYNPMRFSTKYHETMGTYLGHSLGKMRQPWQGLGHMPS